jgi:DNA polymerase-3 subunit chi
MRVDFYQLTRDPVEAVLPLIARNTLAQGQRLLVVSEPDQFDALSNALWTRLPESFLAHGRAGEPHEARQPVLLSAAVEPANGARYVALADGIWREEALDPALAFDDRSVAARAVWRTLGGHEGLDRHLWKQDGGKWQEVG